MRFNRADRLFQPVGFHAKDALNVVPDLNDARRAKLFQQGWQVKGTTAEGLANRIQTDTRALGAVITSQGIEAE